MKQLNHTLSQHYSLLNKLFFGFVVCIWLIRLYNDLLLHQLNQPVLPYEGRDPFYWMMVGLQVPQFIVGSKLLSLAVDFLILISALGSIFFQRAKLFNILFVLSYFIYFFVFNTFLGHHFHSVGVLFVSLMFLFKKDSKRFIQAFELVRYYFFFMLCSAFLWKLVRGNLWDIDHFSNILKVQHVHFLQANPTHWKADMIVYLINNESLSYLLWLALMLLQGMFFIGFFTKKYDGLLLLSYLFFIVGSWLFMNILNLDNLSWFLVLLPFGFLVLSKNKAIKKGRLTP